MTPDERQEIEDSVRLMVEDFQKWSHDVVERPNRSFNGLPACPFAGAAWAHGLVNVHITPELGDVAGIKSVMDAHDPEVNVILWTGWEDVTPDEFNQWVDDQNKNHFGIWVMGFHPDAATNEAVATFDGLIEDDYGVILVQSLAHLVRASDRLRRAGYYQSFDQEDMKYINGRRETYHAWHEKVAKKMLQTDDGGPLN